MPGRRAVGVPGGQAGFRNGYVFQNHPLLPELTHDPSLAKVEGRTRIIKDGSIHAAE